MPEQAMKQYSWRDLLAMPDDGVERWIVDGELKEWRPPAGKEHLARVKDRFHSRTLVCVSMELLTWLNTQHEPRGWAGCLVGIILATDPETTLSADVACFGHEVDARQTADTPLMVGVPFLAVEILSPDDTVGFVNEQVRLYRRAGVPLVWIVDPIQRTITIHAHGARPRMVAAGDELACEPHLPGFRIPAARLFE